MMGEAPIVTSRSHPLTAAETEAVENALLWWEQPFSLDPGMPWSGSGPRSQSWEEIGNRMLKSAGVDDGDAESIRSTYLEIVNQALSGVAGSLSTRARQEVSCENGARRCRPARAKRQLLLRDRRSGQAFPRAGVFSGLAEILRNANAARGSQTARSPPRARPRCARAPHHSPIDLLLDVELPVSVSFGRAQLALKDVIKLTTGSIVELNRACPNRWT